jgi:hypothetical protein
LNLVRTGWGVAADAKDRALTKEGSFRIPASLEAGNLTLSGLLGGV